MANHPQKTSRRIPPGWPPLPSRTAACPNDEGRARPHRFIIRHAPFCILLPLLAGCAPTSLLITPVSAGRQLREHILSRESVWTDRRIAIIDLDGVLSNQRPNPLLGGIGDNPVSVFKEKLDKAAKDKRVKAVVLRINSSGGGVTASDLMYREVLSFREKSEKPVIACLLDVAASGGYYVACAADRILAHPTTVTGSIGVIMILPEISGTMQKLGIRTNVFKSGDMKDAGSPFRELNEADARVFRKIIDQMYERFIEVAARSRKELADERLRELADGRVYYAAAARECGLIDEIGTLQDAIATAKEAAGIADKKVIIVQYARPLEYRPNIYARSGQPSAQLNLLNIDLPDWLRGRSPQFMYLWAPGW